MFVEYDWTAGVYKFRFGHVFIDVRGYRSCSDMNEVKWVLGNARLKLGRKTDSRTWSVECVE